MTINNRIDFIHPKFKLNGCIHTKESLLQEAEKLCQSNEEHLLQFGHLIIEWFNEKDYLVLHTSGTTGTPKQIRLKKQAITVSAEATVHFFDVKEGSTALLCMSTAFVGGKLMFIRALLFGWELDVVKPTARPLAGVTKYYNFVAMVPMQVENSLNELNQVEKLIIGGAKVNANLVKALSTKKTQVFETYGMTETITHIAAKKINESFFTVLSHASIAVDDRSCLVIDAPQINPDKLVTNDLVELLDSNKFEWIGRWDNVINSGGVKLFPEKIEEKLAAFIPYRFFIAGKEDNYFGTIVVLVIESEPYELPKNIFATLAKYEQPKEIQFVIKFEETASGKIVRKKNIK